MSGMSVIMTIMQDAARKASRNLLRDFNEVEHLQIARKGPKDFVNRAHIKAESTIVEMLSEGRPGYGFLLEEGGEITGSDKTHRFIIAPLQGKVNYAHGIPHFAISIALEREIDGNPREVVAGMVYNPITDEMFMAEKGKGAFVNDGTRGGADRRLRPAQRDIFQESLFATSTPFIGRTGHARFLKELHKVMGSSYGVRTMGAASLDLVATAAGRFDGYWERDLAVWDVAAGLLIAQEAGCVVESLSGADDIAYTGDPLVSNAVLLPMLKERLAV
ncbi:inositol monophosphatase [Litorimonas cladophorae]|uniref:Inositol-1-monophosphatase n=1 Tax=Litorimonas cladophorae TaxID=1220491 RepID=A0A918KQD4_9PROT|nr:inositol monophosphatase family protein [Litorimonas cladophorae]GGX69236.1 inositol monophosphatase [Litorimonas cladophorae]